MVTAAATALLWAALAGIDGTAVDLQVSGRAETSAHAYVPDQGLSRGLAALDVLPQLSASFDRKTVRWMLRYEPQLRGEYGALNAPSAVGIAHGGSAGAEWDVSPLWRVRAAAHAGARIIDFVSPEGGEVARLLDLRVPATDVRLLDAGATAGAEGRPTRLLTLRSTLGVDDTGGLGTGRVWIPRMRALRLAGSVARQQTQQDEVRLELAGVAARFDAGSGASLATITAGWLRDVTRALRLRLAFSASDARAGSTAARVLPGGEAVVDWTPALLGRPLHASAVLRGGPGLDRFGPGIQERVGVDGALSWALTPRWSAGLAVSVGHVVERLGYSAMHDQVRAEWRASPRSIVYASVWNERHWDPRAPEGEGTYWGTSLGVEVSRMVR